MSDDINDGGPAFPRNYNASGHNGMSLRDWFAGQAPVTMQDAALACGWADLRDGSPCIDSNRATIWAVMSMLRYEYADAMLAARKGGAA